MGADSDHAGADPTKFGAASSCNASACEAGVWHTKGIKEAVLFLDALRVSGPMKRPRTDSREPYCALVGQFERTPIELAPLATESGSIVVGLDMTRTNWGDFDQRWINNS